MSWPLATKPEIRNNNSKGLIMQDYFNTVII